MAFEELLQHAKSRDVDFLLFGGDLFDENSPDAKIFKHTLELLHQNITGKKEIFEICIEKIARLKKIKFLEKNQKLSHI